jgi:hypothetical protein
LAIFPGAQIDLGPYDLSMSIISGYGGEGRRPTPFGGRAPTTACAQGG